MLRSKQKNAVIAMTATLAALSGNASFAENEAGKEPAGKPNSAQVQDIYGPPAPVGYKEMAPIGASLSALWSTVRSKVSTVITNLTAPKNSSSGGAVAPIAKMTEEPQSPKSKDQSYVPLLNMPKVDGVQAHEVDKTESISITDSSRNQPREFIGKIFEKNGGREAPSVAAILATLKNKKNELQVKPLAGSGKLEERAKRFDAKLFPSEPKFDANAFIQKTVLVLFKELNLIPVDLLPPHSVELVWSVLQWQFSFLMVEEKRSPLTDKALKNFHLLSKKAKSDIVRSKSESFEGWILSEEAKMPDLGTLRLVQALQDSPLSADSAKSDAAILATLGSFSGEHRIAKDWVSMDLAQKASEALAARRDLPKESVNAVNPVLMDRALGYASLVLAEDAFEKKQFEKARKLALDISKNSELRDTGRYLAAVCLMSKQASKQERAAMEAAGKELTELFRTVDDDRIFDATAVTLGRIHFLLGNYEAANKYFSQVSRTSNLFIESAIDNAWALLRGGDKNHAVGNIFTLHTSFFDGAFMPESHFVQTLGYQELCQFGDALTSVKQYKARYHSGVPKIANFNNGGKQSEQNYYNDLVAYLSKQEHNLPEIVLREMGRHPEFIKRQAEINFLMREQKTLTASFPSAAESILAKLSPRIDSMKSEYKGAIGKYLKRRAIDIETDLKFLSSNMALLEYEIFAGASQNLALQGAQNFAVAEGAAKEKDADGKEYWPYEEEIWEDELNHFRSKIVDGCAKVRQPASSG